MRVLSALLPVAFVVCWSSGFVGASLAAQTGAAANTTLFWRYALTTALLAVVAVARRRRYGRAFLVREIVLGLLGQAVYLSGVFHGATLGVPAGTSALIASLQPVVVAVITSRIAREPLGARRALGLLAGFLGVAIVVATDVGTGGGALGVLAVVVGMAGLAMATLLGDRRPRPSGYDLLDSLTVQSGAALAGFALVAAAGGEVAPPSGSGFWVALALLVVVSFVGGYGCYLLVLDRSGSLAVSALLFLTPAVAAAWSAAALDEPLQPTAIPGFLLALTGVIALRRKPETTPAPRRPAAPSTDWEPTPRTRGSGRCRTANDSGANTSGQDGRAVLATHPWRGPFCSVSRRRRC